MCLFVSKNVNRHNINVCGLACGYLNGAEVVSIFLILGVVLVSRRKCFLPGDKTICEPDHPNLRYGVHV